MASLWNQWKGFVVGNPDQTQDVVVMILTGLSIAGLFYILFFAKYDE
jgi:hypothetical protein